MKAKQLRAQEFEILDGTPVLDAYIRLTMFASLQLQEIAAQLADFNEGRKTMARTEVKSSSIKAVGYSPETQKLEIEFHGGRVYRYTEVPADVAKDFLAAESIGKAFASDIRGRFSTERLPDAEPDPRDVKTPEASQEPNATTETTPDPSEA